jgi:hypothetical protein
MERNPRLKGSVLMRQGERRETEIQLRASIEFARQQQARSWEFAQFGRRLAELLIECGQRLTPNSFHTLIA